MVSEINYGNTLPSRLMSNLPQTDEIRNTTVELPIIEQNTERGL
jgi:hypothetical protein